MRVLWLGFLLSPTVSFAGPDVYGLGNGQDGDRTLTDYQFFSGHAPVTAAASAGATSIRASSSLFAEGDLVLIHQTAGVGYSVTSGDQADIDLAALGEDAGYWELARVTGARSDTLALDRGLLYSYASSGAQVVRVHEYENFTINGGAGFDVDGWNGSSGGIIAVLVRSQFVNNGGLDAGYRGLRGGTNYTQGYESNCTGVDNGNSGRKGEGLSGGFGDDIKGYGNLTNGAGGGNCHNGGGGGGGAGGTGGNGGRPYNSSNDYGGRGGAAVLASLPERAVFGGGGGAGESNGSSRTGGEAGGGFILVRAPSMSGTGYVASYGGTADDPGNDGGGGGGAGGTVIAQFVGAITCDNISADGGWGGSVDSNHGPGGGGAGGFVYVEADGATCDIRADFGEHGLAGSSRRGSQDGDAGVVEDLTGNGGWFPDYDGDGYSAAEDDCDDFEASINPAAADAPADGIDDNCDGVDECYFDGDEDGFGDGQVTGTTLDCSGPNEALLPGDCDDGDDTIGDGIPYWADGDGDGYGDGTADPVYACSAPSGTVGNDRDCDDSNAGLNPDTLWYRDRDGDGYGDPGDSTTGCLQPSGYVANADDCDDGDAAAGLLVTAYTDGDGDGYGDGTTGVQVCQLASNQVLDGTDCDDGNPEAFPGAVWYPDLDGDGYGDASNGVESCLPIPNSIPRGGDCNDADRALNPETSWYADTDGDGLGDALDAVQQCDPPQGRVRSDEDCDDGDRSVGLPLEHWPDTDGDGFGDGRAPSDLVCPSPEGWVTNPTDCDDGDASINPTTVWYGDADGDGYGATAQAVQSCTQPSGHVRQGGDCRDGDPSISPGATEVCDGIDNDCDRDIDDADDSVDASTYSTFWRDDDGDGYGLSAATAEACAEPAGYTDQDADCDDTLATVNPGAPEQCNSLDDDCNGLVDDQITQSTWYLDNDGDGYGDDTDTLIDCAQPEGYVLSGGDCDDADTALSPAAEEICDGVDQDCDGVVDDDAVDATVYWADTDGDGFGDPDVLVRSCDVPSNAVSNSDDCNDARADANPTVGEVCDGIDNDCNGFPDDDAADASLLYPDNDGDGYGATGGTPQFGCEGTLIGFVADDGDCDDRIYEVNPGAPELCDGLDNDCNGLVDDQVQAETWYADLDGDGYGDDGATIESCDQPSNTSDQGGDCDDTDASAYPGATEVGGNTIDEDCDGIVEDVDGDGYASDDCDDENPEVNPGAEEVDNGIDDDCDGEVDEVGLDPNEEPDRPLPDTVGGSEDLAQLPSGCSCDSTGGPSGALGFLALLAPLLLRRRV